MCKLAFLCIVVFLLAISPAWGMEGCYSIVAGKKATADGSVLFGHNEDNARKFVAGLWKVERMTHTREESVQLQSGTRIPQAETTLGYWWLQMPELDYSDVFLNEYGVAIATDACHSREDNPDLTNGGIGGPALRRIIAERACTAREGVKLLGSFIERYGYTASGRTLVVCDANEGWLVGLVNGKHWVAARVPDDRVALIANTYTIRQVDLSDTLNYLGSPDLIEYAVKRGWYSPSEGPFDFEKAYADRKGRINPGNTHRQWSGLNRLSAAPVPPPEEQPLPFAVKPKEPLTVKQLTGVLRDHYENTPYEPAPGYETKPAHKRHTSTICSPGTNSSSVFQLRSWLPVEIGAVWWLAMWQPCSTPYMPIYAGMDMAPEELAFGGDAGLSCPFCVFSPEFGTAYKVFSDLSAWADEDYAARIPALHKQWRSFEQASFAVQNPLEDYVSQLWNSERELARDVLSRYCQGVVARAVQQGRLFMVELESDKDVIGQPLPR